MKKSRILLAIIFTGIFLRVFWFKELFYYSHDQDLLGWFILDVLGGHIRLIGQETSQLGVFIGPLFYYAATPFYLLSNMDPVGGLLLVILINIATIYAYYFVFSRVFGKKVGLIAATIYAVSFSTVMTSRELVPTQPVALWVILFLYNIHQFLETRKKAFILFGILAGLIWHLNMGLILLIPLSALAFIFSKRKLSFREMLIGLVLFIVLSLPLFAFEARYDFQQLRAITSSLVGSGGGGEVLDKFDRTMQLASQNVKWLIWGPTVNLPSRYEFYALVVLLAVFIYKKIISRKLGAILAIWIATFIIFFTLNSINLSEYYLNSLNVIWIGVIAIGLSLLFGLKRKIWFYLAFGGFIAINLFRFFTIDIDRSGYIDRKAIIKFIAEDSRSRDYPCVSVSYITEPGRDFGFRYLFYLEDLHVNQPKSMSPVYTIVFPHSMVDRIDMSFGALGLVLPDYERYNKDSVEESCAGENANLTDPLFGFTK